VRDRAAFLGGRHGRLFAPRLRGIEQIRAVLEAVDRPLNVLVWQEVPPVAELAREAFADT
jgi:hypothetical protein